MYLTCYNHYDKVKDIKKRTIQQLNKRKPMKNPNEHIQLYYVNEGTFNNEGKFVKTPGTHPVATIALAWQMPSGNNAVPIEIARGIAICGKNDQFSRIEGRKLAISRARHALYGKESNGPICDGGSSNRFVDCLTEQFPECNETMFDGEFTMSSEAFAELAPHEEKLIAIYMEKISLASTSEEAKETDMFQKAVEVCKVAKATKATKATKTVVKKAKAKA